MKNTKICEVSECTGCFACKSICGKDAIEIEEDITNPKRQWKKYYL